MKERTFEIGHAQVLLDVIFGVIIALPLIEVPKTAKTAFTNPSELAASWGDLLLSTAALIFASFYWLEVRHFLAEQDRFNLAIKQDEAIPSDGVPLPLSTYLVGSLIMMTLAAGILAFANTAEYQTFLILNILFWLADAYGTASLKKNYLPFEHLITAARQRHPHAYDWFVGHIESPFFYLYAIGNAAFFGLLFLLDKLTNGVVVTRSIGALAIMGYTMFRHGFVRATLYTRFRDRWLRGRTASVEMGDSATSP